jgi:DNA-directed RNA polymerase III subunit RPC3
MSPSEPVSVANISIQTSDDDDLGSGIAVSSSNTTSIHALLKEYLAILACADNPTPAGRAASFVSVGGGGTGKVQVEFEIICKRLRQRILEAVARERYGDDAVRIIRVLLIMDKMDEKHVRWHLPTCAYLQCSIIYCQLAKVAMMSHKDVRPLLTSLSSDSLISLQEVPKGNDRNPARTFYLWYVFHSSCNTVPTDRRRVKVRRSQKSVLRLTRQHPQNAVQHPITEAGRRG